MGWHAYDEPSGTQPRMLHGVSWALNASLGWSQVGISRVGWYSYGVLLQGGQC